MIFNQVSKEEINKINEVLSGLPKYHSFDFAFTPDTAGLKSLSIITNVSGLGLKKDKVKSVSVDLIGSAGTGTATPRFMWNSSGNLNGAYVDINVVKTSTSEKTGTVHIVYTE